MRSKSHAKHARGSHGYRFLVHLSRVAAKHTTRDTAKYTKCAAWYLTYPSQRISHAIVMNGAAGILGQIKKKSAGPGLGGRACGAL